MEIKDARCTNCGASLKVEPQKTLTECEYCHSTIMVSDAVELALVEVDKTKDIKSHRENLKKAVASNSVTEIKRISELLRDIVPDDFAANYYYGYALASLGDVKFLRAFYESPKPGTDEAVHDVVDHLFMRSDLRDKSRISAFLNQVAPNHVSAYEKMHAERVQVEDLYAPVPKDVFVCFSSYDRAVAEKAVKTLEADGYTCWISTRNLRPDDAENYWKNIKTAIHNARTVLVISSQHAMISKDVQEEIETAQKAKKPTFEYKVDQAPHTVLFKHVFNGVKWVDGTENPLKQIDKLPKRVYEELQNAPEIKKPVQLTDFNPPKSWIQKFIIPIIIIAILGVSGVVAGMSGVFAPAEYTVEFIDYDGVTIDTQVLEEGLEIAYPSSPDRDGYTFTGWSSEPETATQNATLRAEYERNTYVVTFEDYDGTVLSSDTVTHGGDVGLPDAPERTGYQFMGWEGSTDSIEANQTLTATYEILTFTVRFNDHNGELLKQEIVEYGQAANPPEVQREGYDFTGWNQSTENITSNRVFNPNYDIQTFTVTFEDFDGTVLSTQTVDYGDSAVEPESPTRDGFIFNGWNRSYDTITSDVTLTARWSEQTLTVTFRGHDNAVLATYSVEYGADAPEPSAPERTGYTFTGWNQSIDNVTDNLNVIAEYQVQTFNVVYKDYDGSTIQSYTVNYGQAPPIPNAPSRDGHTFDGWDQTLSNVTRNVEINATYSVISPDPEPSSPVITGNIDNVTIEQGSSFNPLNGVSASDENDGDLTAELEVSGSVNVNAEGTYTITYTVENSDGIDTSVTRTVTVVDSTEEEPTVTETDGYVLANGVYDFKFAPVDLKNQFFAAAERYLVTNHIGGIPLWASSSYNLFSDRMQLPTEGYDPVLGFGIAYASMKSDDSTVTMDDGQAGEVGEYTYRTRLTENPATLNQWIYEDSISSDVITTFLDTLYFFNYNSNYTGFELQPSMASGMPSPVDSQEVFGTEVANIWSVPVREGLVWTDHTGAEAGDITAQDFLDTYKLAVDNGWFRAISGGGDFLNPEQEIVNMQAYVDGDAEWDEVGISVEGNNIVFEFVPLMSEWNVIYWLSGFVMTPINLDLYEEVGDQYGTSAETTSYSGRFYLETYEADRILRLKENPNFHAPNRTFYTGYTFEIINDPDIAFQSFITGRLDATGLPSSRFEDYQDFPGIRIAPGATVFRMNLNAHGTVESQRAQFPDSSHEPEPILAYEDFRNALYFGINREELAVDVQKTAEPAQFYFTPAYLVDPAGGVSFRDTQYGQRVLEGLSPSTQGYNPDAAKAFFDSAIEDAVAAGDYSRGDVIELLLVIAANSQGAELAAEFIKSELEENFYNEEFDIGIDIVIQAEPFPNNYFNFIIPGETDMGFGGISGSTLDAAGFLDTFNSLNTSGFTLNWGPDFDTTQANIEIEYVNPSTGETLREIFSFDALQRLLTSEVELEDGMVIE